MSSETVADKIGWITDSALFRRVVITLIVLNAIIVGLDTYPQIHAAYGKVLSLADRIILYVFSLELVLRLLGSNPPIAFFRSGWNLFDLIIVGVSFLPASQFFTVARLFRILRALRTVSVLPDLQKVVTALLRSLPALGHILILLALLMYVYAAIGTSLFGEFAPKYFGSLHQSVLTLFSVITLEGWIAVMDEVLPHIPAAWIYFVTFILFATFVFMNFFVGVIVNNLQAVEIEERDDIAEIRKALARVEAQLQSRQDANPSDERSRTHQQHLERAS
ncbi:MAG TPA: ion transporter [Terrimicrobiaceae bacterium]